MKKHLKFALLILFLGIYIIIPIIVLTNFSYNVMDIADKLWIYFSVIMTSAFTIINQLSEYFKNKLKRLEEENE